MPELRALLGSLLLLALTCAVFATTVRNDFISLDDKSYIYDNPQVLRGLSRQTALWALRSTENANWYPVTRLTHLVDASLFGMWAGGHHLMSVAWHAAAAVLLFLALRRMTGLVGRSFVVAALFVVHPLQVESVAWASERSNVLAGFFFGLTLLLWARYAQRPERGRFLAVILSCTLGLMSKPVLVTLPFVLLLLDAWPLGRLGDASGRSSIFLRQFVLEKAPLLVLVALTIAMTVFTQDRAGALRELEVMPLGLRINNAALSYLTYLWKLFWPMKLTVYYPHPGRDLAVSLVLLSVLLLTALTLLALSHRRRRPWLITGWFWFAGMLVPMIGIVQVGSQSMADRYAYLASGGIFVALAWLFAEGLRALRAPAAVGVVAVAVMLSALGALTMAQAGLWRNSRTLFAHALASTQPNSLVLTNLGHALADEGRVAEALSLLEQAVRLAPRDPKAHNGLGYALSLNARPAEAVEQFRAAVELAPDFVEGRSNLGIALSWTGRLPEAREQLLQTIRINPAYAEAYNNLGKVNGLLGRGEESIASYRRAIEIKPTLLAARFNLGAALLKANRFGEAASAFEDVLRIAPDHARARSLLLTARSAGNSRVRVGDGPREPGAIKR